MKQLTHHLGFLKSAVLSSGSQWHRFQSCKFLQWIGQLTALCFKDAIFCDEGFGGFRSKVGLGLFSKNEISVFGAEIQWKVGSRREQFEGEEVVVAFSLAAINGDSKGF
jgi:hypothetical protein